MIDLKADVAVVGAGFGGSLMALVLERIGLRPVLIDRGAHPRFAIGESSTPVANLVLRDLCRAYGLPRIAPLAKYGTWQEAWPQVTCGLKRGFSYFRHVPGEPFRPDPAHANELLVAASALDRHADTQWLRSEVDAFLVREVQAAGIPYCDRTHVEPRAASRGWRLEGERLGEPVLLNAAFVVDASGPGGFLARAAAPGSSDSGQARGLKTNSRALFGHFAGVEPWHDLLQSWGGRVENHPFCCDDAAQHHLLEEGWMWQIRFNNGVTSAGFVLDAARHPLAPALSAEQEWRQLMDRYPSLAAQFSQARLIEPERGLCRTGRLQRRAQRIAGENWVRLPHAAGFIDPLHSSGIAQSLCGIERLAAILGGHWGRSTLAAELARYEQTVWTELSLIDDLVHGCYAARGDFDLFTTFAMLYFAAATTSERRRLAGRAAGAPEASHAFLCADDPAFRAVVDDAGRRLSAALDTGDRAAVRRFQEETAAAIAPFNTAGLCDPRAGNMYRYTAVPLDAGHDVISR